MPRFTCSRGMAGGGARRQRGRRDGEDKLTEHACCLPAPPSLPLLRHLPCLWVRAGSLEGSSRHGASFRRRPSTTLPWLRGADLPPFASTSTSTSPPHAALPRRPLQRQPQLTHADPQRACQALVVPPCLRCATLCCAALAQHDECTTAIPWLRVQICARHTDCPYTLVDAAINRCPDPPPTVNRSLPVHHCHPVPSLRPIVFHIPLCNATIFFTLPTLPPPSFALPPPSFALPPPSFVHSTALCLHSLILPRPALLRFPHFPPLALHHCISPRSSLQRLQL